jgi:hypothetical protein
MRFPSRTRGWSGGYGGPTRGRRLWATGWRPRCFRGTGRKPRGWRWPSEVSVWPTWRSTSPAPTRDRSCSTPTVSGGVSGPPIRAHALRAVQTLRGLTEKPIIGGGGITRCGDVAAFAAAGAQAFSIGSSFLWSPWRPNRIVRQYREEFAREEIVRSLNETPRYEPWWDGDYVPGEGCDVP